MCTLWIHFSLQRVKKSTSKVSCRCGCREVSHVSYVTEQQSYCILNCGENIAKCHKHLPLPPRQKQTIEKNCSGFTHSTAEVTRRPDNSQTAHFHDLGPKFPKQKAVVQNSFQIVDKHGSYDSVTGCSKGTQHQNVVCGVK